MAPSLFVLASNALHYLLRNDSLSLKIRKSTLPNQEELINLQFADDTAFFVKMEQPNMDSLLLMLKTLCLASGAKLSCAKSIILSWQHTPTSWFFKHEFERSGPSKIVRYLSMTIVFSPYLKDMWDWVKNYMCFCGCGYLSSTFPFFVSLFLNMCAYEPNGIPLCSISDMHLVKHVACMLLSIASSFACTSIRSLLTNSR